MKKTICQLILLSIILTSLNSCAKPRGAYEMLKEFVTAYGAEGIIYSPAIPEGEAGYIEEGLLERAYIFSGRFAEDYAILLNVRTDFPSECGVFVCSDAEAVATVEEACLERVRLFATNSGFVKRRGSVVYYSTMKDKDRAEKLFNEIIK